MPQACICSTRPSTFAWGISPSYGQKVDTESAIVSGTPAARASSAIASTCTRFSAIVMFEFFLL